ncbi:DUF3127 domain-containing protein [Elizabethkingia anophelis]|nr:DUF3127 domain-containing protein [Elizabethkingia anophelis]
MELTGMIMAIDPAQQRTEDFTVQEFILDISQYQQGTGKKYENYAKLQVTNDRIELLKNLKINDRVHVSFNVSGRIYEKDGQKRFGQNLNVFKITKL